MIYILTKAKLDACEQRWISKLELHKFEIKYIPGPKKIVADSLSRELFIPPSALHRLTKVPDETILAEANAVRTVRMQDLSHSQEVGCTLIGEDGLMVMAGAESVEWYLIHQTNGFHVLDAIPFAPLQTLL